MEPRRSIDAELNAEAEPQPPGADTLGTSTNRRSAGTHMTARTRITQILERAGYTVTTSWQGNLLVDGARYLNDITGLIGVGNWHVQRDGRRRFTVVLG